MAGLNDYLSDFERLEKSFPGRKTPWIEKLHQQAIHCFSNLGFPTPREEAWRLTNLSPLTTKRFTLSPPSSAQGIDKGFLESCISLEPTACQLVFVNGHYRSDLSSISSSIPLQVGPLSEVLEKTPEKMEPHLGRYASLREHALVALNTAFMNDGAFVYLPKDSVIPGMVHLLFISMPAGEETFYVSHPRVLVVAEEGSQATIVESFCGGDSHPYFTNAVTELWLGENARLGRYKVQEEGEKAYHLSTTTARLGRNSRFISSAILLGGTLSRDEMTGIVEGEGGECTLNGLYVGGARQHIDCQTIIDHVQSHGTSRELYKGILGGCSRGVFNGRIVIRKGAQKCDALQLNKNLLLSEEAVVDPKPSLEIFADDVKCRHGATIGHLDSEALFYLQSRGMDAEAARRLLIEAFAREIIDRIQVEALRAHLEKKLADRFSACFEL